MDVKRRLLSELGDAAVFAAVACAIADAALELDRDVVWISLPRLGACLTLGAQPKQRKQIGELAQTFRLDALILGQGLSAVLLVQQRVQPSIDAFRESEARQVFGKIDLEHDFAAVSHCGYQSSRCRRAAGKRNTPLLRFGTKEVRRRRSGLGVEPRTRRMRGVGAAAPK